MTVLCGGGTSSANTGVEDNLVYAAGATQLLGLVPGLEWLLAVAPVLGVLSYYVPTLCASDPPGFPAFTLDELLAFTTSNLNGDYTSFLGKVKATADTIAWSQFCHCDTGSTPVLPTAPGAPAGSQVIPGGGGNIGTPCATLRYDIPLNAIGVDILHVPKPAGATGLQASGVVEDTDVRVGFNSALGIQFRAGPTGAFTEHTNLNTNQRIGRYYTPFLTIGASSTEFGISTSRGGLNADGIEHVLLEFYCGNTPGTGSSTGGQQCNLCPPDPILLGAITQLTNMVTLMQRQLVPFSYISGTAHHSLTGSGTLAVQGIIGALLNVSGLADFSVDYGIPDTFYDVGHLRFGTASGYSDRIPIDTDSQVVFPPTAGVWTVIAYDLQPGVSMTLTELRREF